MKSNKYNKEIDEYDENYQGETQGSGDTGRQNNNNHNGGVPEIQVDFGGSSAWDDD